MWTRLSAPFVALTLAAATLATTAPASAETSRNACKQYRKMFCGGKVAGYPKCLTSHAAETSDQCQEEIKENAGKAK